MSQKLDVDGLVKERLPPTKEARNRGVVHSGLRKRPEFEQIVNYLNYGQETVRYPDREAKFIRNHPYMTQLDFFDMQEDQQRAWEQTMRDRVAEELAKDSKTSKAMIRATETKDSETQDRLVSNEEIDNVAENAVSVYERELENFKTRDKNRRESNANTMDFSLAMQSSNPTWDYPNWRGPSPSAPPPPDDEDEYEEEEASGSASAGPRRKRVRNNSTAVGPDGESLPLRFLRGIGNFTKRGAFSAYDYAFDPTGARAEKAAEEAEMDEERRKHLSVMQDAAYGWANQRAREEQEAWARYNASAGKNQPVEFSIATPRGEEPEIHPVNWDRTRGAAMLRSGTSIARSAAANYPWGLNNAMMASVYD
jgi:hypothetical protein